MRGKSQGEEGSDPQSGSDPGSGSDPASGSDPSLHPYDRLTPDVIVDAVELAGFLCDGRVLALGSYENRVYQVGVEDAEPVVVKFYRPGRWIGRVDSRGACIRAGAGGGRDAGGGAIAVSSRRGQTRKAGQTPIPEPSSATPDSATPSTRAAAGSGRSSGPRNTGSGWGGSWAASTWSGPDGHSSTGRDFRSRRWGRAARSTCWSRRSIPEYIAHRYERVAGELIELVEERFEAVGPVRFLRLHGDCHRNNVLWTDQGPHFVDLDDCMTGPAIQDLWMLLAGTPKEMRAQLDDLLEGYSQFADFDYREIALIEPLRALRMMHYTAWLARRWEDPAFPLAFPWFGEARYWERHVAELEEQVFAVDAAK